SILLSPISRIEQSSKNCRCVVCLEKLVMTYFHDYHDAIIAINSETLKENLAIMYNMCNIIPHPQEDTFALEYLKHCFQKTLCHFPHLDVRDFGWRDYEYRLATVNERV
ncbi:31097_t:CDS:2, partial [Gigaspora margarita]